MLIQEVGFDIVWMFSQNLWRWIVYVALIAGVVAFYLIYARSKKNRSGS